MARHAARRDEKPRPGHCQTGTHRGRSDRHLAEPRENRRGAGGVLPPYSPDLNPIEQVFAKLKHFLRKAAERTAPATWRRIGTLLDDLSPAECANYRQLRIRFRVGSSRSSEEISRNGDLGHLECDIAAVAHDLRADL